MSSLLQAALRRRDGLKLEERLQLQAERRGSIAARSELETLCREQQAFYKVLRVREAVQASFHFHMNLQRNF